MILSLSTITSLFLFKSPHLSIINISTIGKLISIGLLPILSDNAALQIITDIASTYLKPINCSLVAGGQGDEADTGPLHSRGIPQMTNLIADTPLMDL